MVMATVRKDMYKEQKNDWQKHLDFILLDAFLLVLALWLATTIRLGPTAIYTFRLYREMCVDILLLDCLYISLFRPYRGILFRSPMKELKRAFKYVAVITLGLIFFSFITKRTAYVSRIAVLLFAVFAFFFVFSGRMLLKRHILKNPKNYHKKVLLAAKLEDAEDFLKLVGERSLVGFDITGLILFGSSDNTSSIPVIARTAEESKQYIEKNIVDEVILINPETESFYAELIDICDAMGLTIHVILKHLDGLGCKSFEQIAGVDAISSCMKLVSGTDLFLKRTIDIIGSLIGVLITAILFIFVAPAIYIADPGPVFFKQKRVGRNGRVFDMYKFRSMYQNAEEMKASLLSQNEMDGQMFKMENDPRIIGSGPDGTRHGLGWFIRTTSIDEFPQFFNVLKGDMSLVGTRPPTLDEWKEYDPHHRQRMRAKPGITGLWQINGRSEITDFEEIVKLDTKYIREWTLTKDIEILLKTVVVVITRKGSK